MHLLFDFDGTMVNSFYSVVEKTNLLADEFKFRKIATDEIEELRNFPSSELIKFLKIPIYKIPKLIFQMRKHLHNTMPQLTPVNDMPRVLEKLYDAKFPLGILTSNSIENVILWLELYNMRHYFNFIHTESNYFSKKYLLKKTLNKYKIGQSQALYICDETRDIEAAKKNNIKSVAVTWGYNSEKALLEYQPSFILNKPQEILTICGLDGY